MKPVRDIVEVESRKIREDVVSMPKPVYFVTAIGEDVTLVEVGDMVEVKEKPIQGKYIEESNIIAKGKYENS